MLIINYDFFTPEVKDQKAQPMVKQINITFKKM